MVLAVSPAFWPVVSAKSAAVLKILVAPSKTSFLVTTLCPLRKTRMSIARSGALGYYPIGVNRSRSKRLKPLLANEIRASE